MKILHTSDWHLGRILHEQSLLEDQRHLLGQVLDIIKNESHDALVVAGDIYDRSLPSADAVTLLSWFLTSLREISPLPVIIIPGNHDSARRLSYCGEILSISGIHIAGAVSSLETPVVIESGGERAAFFPIPFLEQGSLAGEDGAFTDHGGALARALGIIEGVDTGDALRIGVAHCFTAQGVVSDSERTFVGGSSAVSPEVFNGLDYTALGHLHRPQQAGERVYYSGSLMKYSFSEHADQKQVLSVDVGAGYCRVEPVPLFPLYDMARIRGSFSSLLNDDGFEKYRDFYIEAELTDPLLVSNAIALLRKRFPRILSVRQHLPEHAETGEGRIDIARAKRDIGDDFFLFHRYLYGKDPEEPKRDLFMKFSETCRRGEDR